jgi:hypothetical protein
MKIYIKIHINITPTCFGLRPSSGSLHLTWPKLYYVKTFGEITSLLVCGCVAACHGMACVLYSVQNATAFCTSYNTHAIP